MNRDHYSFESARPPLLHDEQRSSKAKVTKESEQYSGYKLMQLKLSKLITQVNDRTRLGCGCNFILLTSFPSSMGVLICEGFAE